MAAVHNVELNLKYINNITFVSHMVNPEPVRLKKQPINDSAKSDNVKKTIIDDGSLSFGR